MRRRNPHFSLPLDVPSFQFVEGFYLIWLILGSGHFFET
jgi:hypothetical protein